MCFFVYKKTRFLVVACFFMSLFSCEPQVKQKIRDYFFSPDITELNISDWKNPKIDDWRLIQSFLDKKKERLKSTLIVSRPFSNMDLNTDFYEWIVKRERFALISDKNEEPIFGIEYFNNDSQMRDKCVICYTSFPRGRPIRDYPKGVNLIIDALKRFNFDGHFIYRIGGFPGIEEGRLKHVDVPYSFKPFFFDEARKLGYKKILWLDACCIPFKSLDPIFSLIGKEGVCYRSLGRFKLRIFDNGFKELMPFLPFPDNKEFEAFTTQVVGINAEDPRAKRLLNEWIKLAEMKVPLLEGTDFPFTLLLYSLGLQGRVIPYKYINDMHWKDKNFSSWKKKHSQSIICHNYIFLEDPYITNSLNF